MCLCVDDIVLCLCLVKQTLSQTVSETAKQACVCLCVCVCLDDWEIPFENISDLQWLGSGAQGAVFLGKLKGELVAIKKLRDKRETDIRHLRKLNHPNIISFKYMHLTQCHLCSVSSGCWLR